MGHERHTLKADAFMKIEERLGRKGAAEAIGITTGNWSPSSMPDGMVTATFELAARHVLSKLDRKRDAPQMVVVVCPPEKANLLEVFCRGLDVETINITLAQK